MWRIRTSDELQAMYRKQNIFTKLKLSSVESAGQTVRMSDDGAMGKYFWGPVGRIKAGRLKLK